MDLITATKQYVNKRTEGINVKTIAAAGVVGAVALYSVGKWYKAWNLQRKLQAFEMQSIAENKIIVHMTPYWDLSLHPSPFVARVLTFLEKNNIPYIIDTTMPMHFYTEKMPWITYKNHHQPDSTLIIDWIQKHPDFGGLNMDKHLNSKQVAISEAFKSMVDDGYTPVIMVRRLKRPENVSVYGELLFGTMGMAPWKGRLFMKMLKGKLDKLMWINGIGRFQDSEVFERGERILSAIVESIGDKKFFFGDELSSVDIWIYATFSGSYQLSRVMTWGATNSSVPSKMPCVTEMNAYMKRVEMDCFGEVKYWKDLNA